MFEIDVCYKFIFESMLEDDVLGYIANKVYEYTHAGIFFVSESGEILAYACSGKDQSMRSIIEGHVTYRDAKIITNDYGHPVLNAIVNYQFEPYGGNGIIRLMQFDELNKEISFQSYSPWVQKKMDILDNKIENKGILNDDEKKLFPFDKLNITQDPSDNITFKFDFTERFKNLDKIESINRESLDEEISLSNSYNLSQYQDGNEKDNFINALSNAKNIQKDLDEFLEKHPGLKAEDIPSDLLTASGSGLDPHISPKSAEIQIPYVAENSGLSEEEVTKIVEENTEHKVLGVFGEERVNVLKCNLAVANAMGILE